eukprot:scaffold42270_cov30-Tisochrysis_lutea.AAC.6
MPTAVVLFRLPMFRADAAAPLADSLRGSSAFFVPPVHPRWPVAACYYCSFALKMSASIWVQLYGEGSGNRVGV